MTARRFAANVARMAAVFVAALAAYGFVVVLAWGGGAWAANDDPIGAAIIAAGLAAMGAMTAWTVVHVWANDRQQRRNLAGYGRTLAACRRELAAERARSASYRADLARARAELAGPAVVAEAEHILRSGR